MCFQYKIPIFNLTYTKGHYIINTCLEFVSVSVNRLKREKAANKKNSKSRHFPCPDWIQNVTVTCKRSHF